MKIVICSDILAGAVCSETPEASRLQKWMSERNAKFAELLDRALRINASYVLLLGRLLGQKRVPESVIDGLFEAARADSALNVIAAVSAEELARITYRSDVPNNFHLFDAGGQGYYSDDKLEIKTENGYTSVCIEGKTPIYVKHTDPGFVISLDKNYAVPSFEPTGFDDFRDKTFGYGILSENGYEEVAFCNYIFRDIGIRLLPNDDRNEITRKLEKALQSTDRSSFLRITFVGRSAFGLSIDTDAVKSLVQKRVFYADVYDNTVMDIAEEDFETDISLRSEFVRLALSDDSLSESERNRIICCGWNVLSGKEVSAE